MSRSIRYRNHMRRPRRWPPGRPEPGASHRGKAHARDRIMAGPAVPIRAAVRACLRAHEGELGSPGAGVALLRGGSPARPA